MEKVTKKVQGLTVSDYAVIPVNIEVTIEHGIGIHFIGVPDSYAKEGLLRIVTALEATGHHCPGRRVIINISAKWPRDERSIRWELLETAITYALACAIEDREPCGEIMCGQINLDGGPTFPIPTRLSTKQYKLLAASPWFPKIMFGFMLP